MRLATGYRMAGVGSARTARRSQAASCAGRSWAGTKIRSSLAQGIVESHPRCNRSRMAELQLPHDRDDGRSLERLLQHRQHLQLVLFADALDMFEHRRASAAHELDESEIAAFAKRHDGFDRVRRF